MRLVGTDAVSKPVTRTLPDAGLSKPVSSFGERGFAGSVLADNAHELAGVERQVEVVAYYVYHTVCPTCGYYRGKVAIVKEAAE